MVPSPEDSEPPREDPESSPENPGSPRKNPESPRKNPGPPRKNPGPPRENSEPPRENPEQSPRKTGSSLQNTESSLEDIEFLALSANRVEVLTLLSESPHTRGELAELTDASQPTLGRILGDLEERTWIRRADGRYAATATGRLVAEGFTDLLEVLETEQRLRKIVQWLPTAALDFDLRRLTDATITTPSQVKPNAPVKRVIELLEEATEVLIVSYALNEQSLDVIHRRAIRGEQTFRGVFTQSAIDAIADDGELRGRLDELLRSDAAEIRVCDEAVPIAVTIVDDVVHFFLRDDSGVLQAAVDVSDPVVRSWALDIYERYWRNATSLDALSSR